MSEKRAFADPEYAAAWEAEYQRIKQAKKSTPLCPAKIPGSPDFYNYSTPEGHDTEREESESVCYTCPMNHHGICSRFPDESIEMGQLEQCNITPEALAIIEAVLDGKYLSNINYPNVYEVLVQDNKPCPTCGGTGTIEAVDEHGDTLNVCPTCAGAWGV